MDGIQQEQRFLKALGEVVRFTVSGDSLELYAGAKRLRLCFQAIALQVGEVPRVSRTGT